MPAPVQRVRVFCGKTMVGKRVVDDLYVHLEWIDELDEPAWRAVISDALSRIGNSAFGRPNVAKINLRTGRLSLLFYPAFEEDPFPELMASWTFPEDMLAPPRFRRYDDALNPPVLHRKELLVGLTHARRESWCAVTAAAEGLGLFESSSTIGFRMNWERAIAQRGFVLDGTKFVPLGNDVDVQSPEDQAEDSTTVRRHLTALTRTTVSAPVQMLVRHGLLHPDATFLDYGCGRGGDIAALRADGLEARGWDPHYAPEGELQSSDVVNLGFVINVIEDAAERVVALERAFSLTRCVLSVGVMLYPSEIAGAPFRDGYLSSRHTFQKYFDQAELRDYLEQVLHQPAFLVAPGVAFVFADKEAEQRFAVSRFRRRHLAKSLLQAKSVSRTRHEVGISARASGTSTEKRQTASERRFLNQSHILDAVWQRALDLGRWPEDDEMPPVAAGESALLPTTARRLMQGRYDLQLLERSRAIRSDDVLLFLVAQQFAKRAPYRKLERRLQRDIKAFFGNYASAQRAALEMLVACAEPNRLLDACQEAATRGLGWLEDSRSLQLHIDLVDRLPAILRAYVACGLVLWGPAGEAQLVKIHIVSGKLSLMEYDDFATSAVPSLRRRVKMNLRRLSCEVFEYGSSEFPKPVLLWKSRYLGEEQPGYAEQLAFDEELGALGLPVEEHRLVREELDDLLEVRRLSIAGLSLERSMRIPSLDAHCGQQFRFRDLIECGETWHRLGFPNLPTRPESYNALYDLASKLLDPVVDYFGSIRLTYGFASRELTREIRGRIAPKLDQHACHELDGRGRYICGRLGAACDFIVDDEDMFEVASWIVENLPFDRLYVYGKDRPLHVSYAPSGARQAFQMTLTETGHLMPRPLGLRRREPS